MTTEQIKNKIQTVLEQNSSRCLDDEIDRTWVLVDLLEVVKEIFEEVCQELREPN